MSGGGLRFEVAGRTEQEAPTVLLSAGLGGLGAFWRPQIGALAERYRVVTYDQRGTGANHEALPALGYTVRDMADDVVALIDELGGRPVHVVGHAFGGLVGLDLAARCPDRLASLTLVNAWATLLEQTRRCFALRLQALAAGGPAAYVGAQPIFLYPASWLEDHEGEVEREIAHGVAHFQGIDNLHARLDALRGFEMSAALAEIGTPTLVVGATDDVLVPVQGSTRLASGLPNAELTLMTGGHACTVTNAADFNAALLGFLARGLTPIFGG